MKPEELDELFRRGLAEQQLTPRAQAWDSIQQRLRAPIGEEDELPAFLRKAPEPVAAPAMTASRGGGGAVMTVSWHQRPMWRAAAVAVLAIGGLLAQQQLQHVNPADSPVAVAPNSLVPVTEVARPAASSPAPVALAATETPVPASTPSLQEKTPTSAAPQPRLKEPVGYALASTDVTSKLIHEHLLCSDHQCQECDLIEQKIGTARFRSLRAEAAAELLARSGMRVVVEEHPATNGVVLASGTTRATRRSLAHPATQPEPQPEAPADIQTTNQIAPLADAIVEVKIIPEAPVAAIEEPVEAPVQVASGARRSLRPSEVLRRAKERLLDRIDRADNRSDGRLTIDTHVAGRPVRKTISL